MECIRDTYSILLALLQAAQERYLPTKKQQRLAPVLEYISRNCHTRIKNDTLASLIGVSNVYFRKLFAEVTGTSPIAYVNGLCIEKAKEMLKSDYGSLSDVAQSLGYANLYDFSRAFKKHVGVSPTTYQKG
jgi:AraC-like DNA-binding protein